MKTQPLVLSLLFAVSMLITGFAMAADTHDCAAHCATHSDKDGKMCAEHCKGGLVWDHACATHCSAQASDAKGEMCAKHCANP